MIVQAGQQQCAAGRDDPLAGNGVQYADGGYAPGGDPHISHPAIGQSGAGDEQGCGDGGILYWNSLRISRRRSLPISL